MGLFKNKKQEVNQINNKELKEKLLDNALAFLVNANKIKPEDFKGIQAKFGYLLMLENHGLEAELKFKVTYDGKDYFGKVVYKNGKINHTTYFDEKCPLDVVHQAMGWSDVLNYVDFYFLVTEKG